MIVYTLYILHETNQIVHMIAHIVLVNEYALIFHAQVWLYTDGTLSIAQSGFKPANNPTALVQKSAHPAHMVISLIFI